ncbi:hypothetical protein CHS0354_023886 [Potamilus streckersoni]|uniref:phosphoglycerate mutase (2,3-diphosphoglycerate-dependent) n=1 Tax=Potamilus streckersoni TaxID=2493646 RepID=A0AAE0VLJ2_9BIVA|nr:hypothetical protein CHS0354_023886 [Potamilus streckersoni]
MEAKNAGKKISDIKIDIAFTSVLIRAKETLRIVLEEALQPNVPIESHKDLNERHYGALQGLNKAETIKKYGEAQVKIWRRSYDIQPPNQITEFNPDGRSESLKDTAARTIPYFNKHILPHLVNGKNILISAHGNSLRAIVMELDKLTKKEVLELNIANGIPIIYEFENVAVKLKRIIIFALNCSSSIKRHIRIIAPTI